MPESEGVGERPLVTFALFAYNQEKYIREAVTGALAQTYEPLEIILSDDCSTDRTFKIIQEMAEAYRGPHRVTVKSAEINRGLAGHVNAVLANSQGEIVVVAAGDDISSEDRVSETTRLFATHPEATAVLLSADVIDSDSRIIGEHLLVRRDDECRTQTIRDMLAWRHVTFGATRAIRRHIFYEFGNLNNECPTEDTPFLMRSLLVGTNILSNYKGIKYRKHNNNLGGLESLEKMNFDEIYNQYVDDIELSMQRGLTTEELGAQLKRWLIDDRRRRDVTMKLARRTNLRLSDFIFLMFHPSFSFKEAIKYTISGILP